MTKRSLLGNFEESILNGRLKPVSTVEGFSAEIAATDGASVFCPHHQMPVTTSFYAIHTDFHRVSSPYMAEIRLEKQGYQIPPKGTVQVILLNPHGSVVKIFCVKYNLSDMPEKSQTFLRQRIFFAPVDNHHNDNQQKDHLQGSPAKRPAPNDPSSSSVSCLTTDTTSTSTSSNPSVNTSSSCSILKSHNQSETSSSSGCISNKWLRYLIHLKFRSSKSGRIYLNSDIKVIVFPKSETEAAAINSDLPFEFRCITLGPSEPKYSKRTASSVKR